MDYVWFLKQRTGFISRYYSQARSAFDETIRKIEAEEPPFHDPPYSEDPEPAYLAEWLEARDSTLIVGETCIAVLSASLKLFIVERLKYIVGTTQEDKKTLKKHGILKGYAKMLGEIGFPIDHAPVDFTLLEEIDLVRNATQHPERLTNINSRYSEDSLEKVPSPIFIDEKEAELVEGFIKGQKNWLMPPQISVAPEAMAKALAEVEKFADWFDEWLSHNEDGIRRACAAAASAAPP